MIFFGNDALVTVNNYNFISDDVYEMNKDRIDCYSGNSAKMRKFCMMTINCFSVCGTLSKHDAMETIQHEVEHLYQESRGDKSVFSLSPHYLNASQYINSIDSNYRNLAQCVYLTYRFEQDGFINGLYGYLKQKNKVMPAWNDIKDSDAYAVLTKFESSLDYLENNKNSETLNYICKEKYGINVQNLINFSKKALNRIYNSIGRVLIKIRNERVNEGFVKYYFPFSGKINHQDERFWDDGNGILIE